MRKIFIFVLLCSVAFAENPYRVFNNFNAGELSPLLNARDDLAKYQSGCQIMENLIPLPQGGATKRPGTKYIAEVKTSGLATRLLPFEYSTEKSYVIEMGNQYARFYADGAQILEGAGSEDISAWNNVTAHWKLNDVEANTVVVDSDGATHNGTASANTDTLTATGNVETCFDFGTTASVEIADSCDFSFTDNSNDTAFSIALWAFVTESSDMQVLLSKWLDSGTSREWRLSKTADRKLQLHLADASVDLATNTVGHWLLNDDAANTNFIQTSKVYTIDDADDVANTFTISDDGDLSSSFPDGSFFTVAGSTGNDGQYTVVGTAYGAPDFVITVAAVADGTDDGTVGPHAGTASANTDTLSTTGKINDCLDFGGSATVYILDSADMSFDDSGTNKFSIAGWVFVEGSGAAQHIFTKWKEVTDREYAFALTSAEKLRLDLHDQSKGVSCFKETDAVLTAGWHFVAVTYNSAGGAAAANGITLYVDNVAVSQTATNNAAYVAMEAGATNTVIGGYYVGATVTNSFQNKIDNVALFNKELSAAEVAALWNAGEGTESIVGSVISAITDDAVGLGWRFLAVTYSAPATEAEAADGIIFYVNGSPVDSTATNNAGYTAMQIGAEEIRIGAQQNAGDTATEKIWADKIDNVAVLSDVIGAPEVLGLYSTSAHEIETPYLTADLFELKYEQSADVLYVTHPDYETRKFSRIDDIVWTLEVLGIENGPFRDQNEDIADFIAASATTGAVTLTATGHTPFQIGTTAGHSPSGSLDTSKSQTGALFKMVHPLATLEYASQLEGDIVESQTEDVSWMDCGVLYEGTGWTLVTGETWHGTIKVQRNYTIGAVYATAGWETVLSFTSGVVDAAEPRNVSTTGTEDEGDAQYRVIYADELGAGGDVDIYFTTDQTDHVGIVEITSVESPTSATGTVLTTLASTDATHKWSEGAWSNYRGWPQTVTFFEDRLTFGGNTSQPDTIWGSVTSDYENMEAGADDDDALEFTLSSRQVNVIEWLVGKDKILIGTSGAEWTMEGGADEPLTPSNVIAKQHSTYGSANLQANLANESVLFFQRGKEKMRELAYNWELDSYVAPDMTILANFVTNGGIAETAFQKTPDSVLWCIRDDGEIPVFSYERQENITAWSRLVTEDGTSDSDFESVVRIHGDPEDEIWVIVERTINSSTVRYVEQFQDRDFGSAAEDAYYVDCGVTYDSTASSAMTGGSHLVGETVSVLADGVVFDDAVVTGAGGITLKLAGTTTTAEVVQWGLPYEVHLQTMPLSWLGDVTIQGRKKKIGEVVANWYNSGDFSIGKDTSKLQTYSISGQTTSQDRKTFPPGYDRDADVYIYQKSPEPLTLLGIATEFQVYQ